MTPLRRRLGTGAVPILAVALTVLAVTPDAGAKVTCQQRGAQGLAAKVTGLPDAPVTGRSYRLTITVETVDAIHEAPQLVVFPCPARLLRGRESGYRWLRATPTGDPRTFTVDVRFPAPGRYAMSVFDLGRQFQDAGLHRVQAAAGAESPATGGAAAKTSAGSSGSSSGVPLLAWIGAGTLVAAAAGSFVATRRR